MGNLKLQRWGIAAALLAPVLALFHRALFDARFAIPFDLAEYHFPLAWQIADGLAHGRVALWDPFTYCGLPLHANVQAQMFYPPAWPFFAVGAAWGADRMRALLEWQVVLHAWLAGLFAYGLARRMGLGRAAALFIGLGFELSGFFVAQAQHLGAVCGVAWVPLAWRAVVELQDRTTVRRIALLASALAMSFLAGFTPVAVLTFVSTAVLAVLLWRSLPAAAAGAAWAVILCAVQILPTAQLAGLSTAYSRGSFSDDGGGMPWQGFVSLLAPGRYGVLDSMESKFGVNPAFLYMYAGLLVAALALAGLARPWRWRAPLFVIAVFCALWLLGGHTPVWLAVYRAVPVALRSSFYQEFAAPAFLLTLCLFAGAGFQRWVAGRRPVVVGLVLCAAVLDPAARAWSSWFVASPAENSPAVTRTVFEESTESPKAARRAIGNATPPGRLETFRDSMHWMSHAPVLGIATPNGNDPLAMERVLSVRRLYAPMQDWERTSEARGVPSPVMDMLNVAALVTWEDRDIAPPQDHYRLISAVHGHRFYVNPLALPRFHLAGEVARSGSLAESLHLLRSREFNPRTTVIVEGSAPDARQALFEPVSVILYEPERVELEYASAVPSVLVSSEAAHPGWKALLDGREASLLMVNGAFRGMAAPAGRHHVTMRYSPDRLWTGGALSLAALLLLLTAALWRRS